jgi:hypothetical protein
VKIFVLSPLLVLLQAATPTESQFDGQTAAAKALSEMAVRLVTGLAAGAMASTFRAAVAELPPVLKQRLQVIVAVESLPCFLTEL